MLTSRLAIFTLRFVMLLGLWAPSCLAWAAECSGDFCPPEACAPAFGFIEPDGVLDVADRSFTIRWHDTDPDQNAVISLYYDTDSAGADGQPIAQGLPEDPDGIIGNQFYWDTGGVPEGKYFIYAVIDDGRHPALTVYSPHAVTVHHAVLNPYPIRPEGLDYIRDFGYAVALSGNYAIVGAPGEGNPYAIPGRAFVFTRIGSYWAEQSELTIEELSFDWDKFGFAVDIDGDTAIVGAPNGLITVQSGTAFIFRRQGSRWVKEDQIKPNGLAYSYYTRLGHAVAISGERVAVGAPNYKNSDDNLPQMGTVYIYKREGSEWHQEWQLSASDKAAWDEFGTSVAISASHVIVGAPKNDDHGSDSGSAYVYHREPEGWAEVKLTASDAAAGAGFGTTVAITESWAAVGAVGDDADGTDSGAVYVFEYNGTVWEQTGKISPPAIDIRGFGRRLDLDGDTLIVGALQDPESGAIRDKAFAYRRINSMWVLLNQWTGMGNGVSVDRDYALLSYFRESDKVVNVVTLRPATILAEAASIRLGESTSLMWHADGFESVSIEPGIGNVEPSSRMSISPVRTTSYRITASGTRGTFTHSVTVAVTPQIGISTSSAWLLPAEAATLSWTSEGADQVTIDNGIGAVPPTGSMAVRPGPAETLYRITASGPGGESTAEVLLTVLSPSALNEIKLRAEKPDPVVEAGTAMAVDGDWMAVGVPYDSEGADVSGAVRLFRREGRGWRFVQKLKAANPREYEKLGTSVAIDGAFLAAGGPGIGRGSVIIFRLEGDGWVEQARVASADSFWNLDTSLALTGDLLAVGADQAVYLFQRSCAQWDPVAKLTASDAARGQLFGRAVAADGNTIVVGAPGGDYTEIPGSAYIFGQQGETWVQQARLTASDTAIKDFFGHAVAVSGNSVIVGGYGNRDRGSWTGAAYVFEKSGSGWSQTARLVAGDRAQYDHFGYALAIQGGRAVVGSPGDMQRGYMAGAVHVFTRGASGWKEAAKLTAGDAHDSDNFGLALALDGDLLGVVAEGFFPWGAAYAYSLALLPPEVELRAEPASIAQGGSSLLSWNAQQAETCAIEPGIGAVAASGSLAVSPNATTTYRITAKGPGGAASAQITVTVQTRPPVAGLSADPQIIYFGESAKLTWTASHADSRLLEPDVGPVSEAGSILVSPSETTSYKLTVTGTGGSAEALAVVTVIKTTGVVSGTIIDSDTGQPLQGVAITITQGSQTRTVYTDADGRFWVTRIGAGEITLTFSIEGYPPLTLNQSIDAGQVLPFVLKLKKVLLQTDTRLTGRITDAASGAAIPGAKITIADSNKTQAVTADAGGAYRVVEIASGKVQLGVSHPDYFPQTWIYQLPGKVTYTVNFALSPKSGRATIEGVVINAKTVQPEAGVELSIEGTLLSAVSDEDGAFTLEDVPMGEQALKVYKKGFVNLVQPITVDSDPFPLELVYPLVFAKARPEQVGKNVTGLVADAVSGRPLPGAILKIRALGLAVAADADGLYSLSGLPPGLITIIAMAPDHEALMLTPVVAEGAAETLDFRLPPTTRGRITGRVFDAATGEAIRFAQVRIGEGSQVAASSEASGTYALLGAPTGGYRLLVFHPEYGEQESQPFTVRDTETTAGVDVALNRRPVTGDLEGVLTDAQTLGAVGGAKLTIQGAAASALTDESGRYELRDAPAGLVTIVIEATGYPTAARTAAVNAHEGSATRTVSRADFRIDAHDPVLPWEVSILIEASAGGFIETPDKRFVVGFPPGALSADAWVTLRPPADGPLVGPGDELEVDPALWLPQEFAAAAPVEIVIEPAAGGAPQPEIAGPVLVSGRYAQADADAFELSEASIFPFYWDGVRWTLLQFSPFETAVDLINNEPVAVLDFSAAISGGALSPDARALESSSGLLRRCMMVFAAIKKRLGPPTPNVNVVDSPELLATKRGLEPRKKPNPNALPLVYIHGWNWNTILVNDELVDPDIGFNELGELIEAEAPMLAFMLNDIVEATNGVYRLMFATHNSRVDILSNGNTLAGILDPQKIYGLPSENNPEPPAFPYLDTVAFSLGGLISRSYQANTGHVHNMVLIGTPNHGTFGVLKLLELHPMYGLYKKIIERWSPGTKDLLHYDDRDNPEKSANPRLAHLNLNPKAAPQSDLTLIAGTDNSKLSGLILPKPNDSVVPVDSVFCRTTDSKDDPKASLLSVCPEAHGRPNLKYEHTAPFNHYTFGAAEFRVRDNEDVRDAILHGLTDWVVSKLLDSKIMTFTDTYYIKSADFTVEVEYNTFKPNEQDLEAGRTGRDIDRVALVIYGQDESGRWHVRGDYAGGDGKLLRSESVVGNSINDDPPITLSTSALFTESEKIVRVAFVVARLRPGRTEVPLDPSGGFGLPNK